MHQQRKKRATRPKKKISSTKMIDNPKYVKGEYVAVCVIARTVLFSRVCGAVERE